MYKVLNINALTLFISRTPKRLKTSCESTSEKAGLARRKTNSKYHFSFQTFKDRYFLLSAAKIRTIFEFYVRIIVYFSLTSRMGSL